MNSFSCFSQNFNPASHVYKLWVALHLQSFHSLSFIQSMVFLRAVNGISAKAYKNFPLHNFSVNHCLYSLPTGLLCLLEHLYFSETFPIAFLVVPTWLPMSVRPGSWHQSDTRVTQCSLTATPSKLHLVFSSQKIPFALDCILHSEHSFHLPKDKKSNFPPKRKYYILI